MPKAKLCQFCATHPSCVTVTRSGPGQEPESLRLCERCGYLCQVVVQVSALEQAMPAPPCFLCGKLSAVTAESKNREGEFLGRFRLCEGCVGRHEYHISDVLRVASPWSPGVLELPPPAARVFPKPPGRTRPGNN